MQLSVPVLTALGAAALLREPIHLRLTVAMVLAVLGIWLTTKRPHSR
jgi:drug/metabolite transporter (DMT)-like permease